MAALDMYNPMASIGYSMPPALSGYDFTPAHTAGDRSIALAERDPAYLQFKQTAMKKYSNLSPVAIANLFHRSKEQRNILPSLDVDALAKNDIKAETVSPSALTNDAKPVFHMGIGNIAGLEAKQSDERNALGALDEYYSNMTADQYDREVLSQKYLTPTFTAADRIKEQQERERLALALSAPPEQAANAPVLSANAPVLTTESSSYDHIPFAADAETQDFSQQTGPMGMSFNPPVPALTSPSTDTNAGSVTGNTVVTKDNTGPVLRQPTSNTARNGNATRRMTGGYTGNARGSALPDMQIGLGERLMRMGMAGLSKGGQGSLAQLGAMFGASADVNQANRQAEMEAFGIEEERRQAHANRVAQLAASGSKGAGGGGGGGDEANAVRGAMSKLQTALEMFEADTDSSISGFNWQAIGSRVFGKAFGNEDEAKRLFLNELRLDSIMRRIRDTKGAISNAEMALFSQEAPTMNSNDIVWTSWIKRSLKMQQIVLNRVQAGQRIDRYAPIEETMPNLNTGGGGSTGGGADFAGADKLVGI